MRNEGTIRNVLHLRSATRQELASRPPLIPLTHCMSFRTTLSFESCNHAVQRACHRHGELQAKSQT
jgi:hypothetical protein